MSRPRKKPFRIKKGYWYSLCRPCEKAVLKYRRGGSGSLMDQNVKCSRCGEAAEVEFYPLFGWRR